MAPKSNLSQGRTVRRAPTDTADGHRSMCDLPVQPQSAADGLSCRTTLHAARPLPTAQRGLRRGQGRRRGRCPRRDSNSRAAGRAVSKHRGRLPHTRTQLRGARVSNGSWLSRYSRELSLPFSDLLSSGHRRHRARPPRAVGRSGYNFFDVVKEAHCWEARLTHRPQLPALGDRSTLSSPCRKGTVRQVGDAPGHMHPV